MVLDASLLNTQHYKVRIKGKVEQSREGVAPSPTLWCGSYRKGSLRVTLDYGRQLYFTLLTSKKKYPSIWNMKIQIKLFHKIEKYTFPIKSNNIHLLNYNICEGFIYSIDRIYLFFGGG